MDRHSIRYLFEHKLLPSWFYKDKGQFVGIILNDKGVLFKIIDDIFTKEEIENPHRENDFNIIPSKITEDILMLKIIFPEPEEEPLCYCSYMFFDPGLTKIDYFCIEKGNELGDMQPFVCAWTEGERHLNYGGCTFEKKGDLLRCLEIYMEKHYGINNVE